MCLISRNLSILMQRLHLIQWYKNACMHVCVCMHVSVNDLAFLGEKEILITESSKTKSCILLASLLILLIAGVKMQLNMLVKTTSFVCSKQNSK